MAEVVYHDTLLRGSLRAHGSPRPRGFSLLELVVVICVVGTLLAVALSRLLPYIDEAERVAVLTLESQLRSTLVMVAAQRIVRGETANIASLNGANPMGLLLETPSNYVGERSAAEQDQVPPRHWYFNLTNRRLAYRPGRPFGLRSPEASQDHLELEVHVAFGDRNGNGAFEPAADELHGVRLQRVAGAEWLSGETNEPG